MAPNSYLLGGEAEPLGTPEKPMSQLGGTGRDRLPNPPHSWISAPRSASQVSSLHITAGETEAWHRGTCPSLASARCHQHPLGYLGIWGCPSLWHASVGVGCVTSLHTNNPSGVTSMPSVMSSFPRARASKYIHGKQPLSSIPDFSILQTPGTPKASSLQRVAPI